MGPMPSRATAPVLDLSYMLILELRELYYEKYSAFVSCRTACQRVYDAAVRFCKELAPSFQGVYDSTRFLQAVPSDEAFAHITTFGERVRREASDAATDLTDVHDIISPVFKRVGPPMALTKFRDDPSSIFQVLDSLSMCICYAAYCIVHLLCTQRASKQKINLLFE